MGLTQPYMGKNYMGEHASSSAALTLIRANKWDSTSNGSGDPRAGQCYYDTVYKRMFYYDGSAWVPESKTFVMAVVPTKLDDLGLGYLPGDIWINTVGGNTHVCNDNSNDAAIWTQINTIKNVTGGYGYQARNWWDRTVPPPLTHDLDLGANQGSLYVDTTNKKLWMCYSNANDAAGWSLLGPQSVWVPLESNQAANVGQGRVRNIAAAGTYALEPFFFPSNLTLDKIYLVGSAVDATNGTGTVTITTSFGADGEAPTTHTDSLAFANFTQAADTFFKLDITDAFTGVAAGDICCMTITHSPTIGVSVDYYGIRFVPI